MTSKCYIIPSVTLVFFTCLSTLISFSGCKKNNFSQPTGSNIDTGFTLQVNFTLDGKPISFKPSEVATQFGDTLYNPYWLLRADNDSLHFFFRICSAVVHDRYYITGGPLDYFQYNQGSLYWGEAHLESTSQTYGIFSSFSAKMLIYLGNLDGRFMHGTFNGDVTAYGGMHFMTGGTYICNAFPPIR